MKIFYWSPWLGNVGTVKAVINSAYSLNKYSNGKLKSVLLNSVGEWYEHQDLKNKEKNIDIINLFKFNFHKYLPKTGFFKSRLSTIFIFMLSIFLLFHGNAIIQSR